MAVKKWINDHPKIIVSVLILSVVALLVSCIITWLPEITMEVRAYRTKKRRNLRREKLAQTNEQNRLSAASQKLLTISEGKLIFKKIPMKVKFLSRNISQMEGETWLTQGWRWGIEDSISMKEAIRCGDSLDVMWSGGAVLFMKEKGLFEEILVGGGGSEPKPYFDDLVWDGQYIWVATRSHGIWLLDTSGRIVVKIGSESGLPPAEKGLRLCPIKPGRILAVGSFGPHKRGWCAIVEFDKGKTSVNVFHKATRVPTKEDNEDQLAKDPALVFSPQWVREYHDSEKDRRIFLVGRDTRSISKAKRYPLEINLDKLSVGISSHRLGRGRRLDTGLGVIRNDVQSSSLLLLPSQQRDFHNQKKRMGLTHHWVSAHYGLVAWNLDHIFYQVITPDDKKDILEKPSQEPFGEDTYFHIFSFEDGNGPVTDSERLDLITLNIRREDKPILRYKYKNYIHGGYFPLGDYKAVSGEKSKWIYKGNKTVVITSGPYKPIKVTAESPEHLIFKPLYPEGIHYRGQVISAITGEPMEGVLLKADFSGIQINKPKWKALTDSEGLFEATFKPSDYLYSFIASKENYMDTQITRSGFGAVQDGTVELQPMLLFPAAKIKIYPCIEEYNSGRPCIEAENVGCWLKFLKDETDFSKNASIFFSLYGGYSSGPEIEFPRLKVNWYRTYYVPAGISFNIKLIPSYREKQWWPPDLKQTLKLKQGEILDLGRLELKPAVKIVLKVVDFVDKPIEGLPIQQVFDEAYSGVVAEVSDQEGLVTFHVEPNSEVTFKIRLADRIAHLQRYSTYKVEGREDEGKVFKFQAPDEIRQYVK